MVDSTLDQQNILSRPANNFTVQFPIHLWFQNQNNIAQCVKKLHKMQYFCSVVKKMVIIGQNLPMIKLHIHSYWIHHVSWCSYSSKEFKESWKTGKHFYGTTGMLGCLVQYLQHSVIMLNEKYFPNGFESFLFFWLRLFHNSFLWPIIFSYTASFAQLQRYTTLISDSCYQLSDC